MPPEDFSEREISKRRERSERLKKAVANLDKQPEEGWATDSALKGRERSKIEFVGFRVSSKVRGKDLGLEESGWAGRLGFIFNYKFI